ncbi:MBL fold metallo-hydrolase [Candidatus Parcubacteria bacterium]|nr:MBL fold metallo-hydrolase [Candidatus Parcubacteria bacterium]
MKITRFAQSCILIETNNKRILIDPGCLQYEESYPDNEWNNIDVLLVTHKHEDHCHVAAIKEIAKDPKTQFHTTKEVAEAYSELSPKIIKVDDVLTFGDIEIEVVKAVHGFLPYLKGGKEIKENIGYIIDDGEKRIYFTGDTICFDNDYKCDILIAPVCGHGLVMDPFAASFFAKETGAQLIIPVHYDHPKHPADFKQVEKDFKNQGLNFKFLKIRESVEV